ncbi:N-acetylmuramoyl-L-alanine amidase [Thiovulum sp. ES]|nr:N-acetylmuramoyl-L-alanine amidase [Thiovulum sp. ES]
MFRILLVSLVFSLTLFGQNPVESVKWEDDKRLVVTFKNWIKSVSEFAFYHKDSGLHKYIFDIDEGFVDGALMNLEDTRFADSIAIGQYKPDTLRITFRNKKELKITRRVYRKQISFIFGDEEKVVKKPEVKKSKVVENPKKQEIVKYTPKPQVKKRVSKNDRKNKLIVIDAGHGGKDGGAVCKDNKAIEKNIVLDIARYTGEYLEKMGYRIHLTRSNDTFIKLGMRTRIANNKEGKLFVSIHANSLPKRKNFKSRNGIETYFLSPAKTERAKRVAAKENSEDMDNMSRKGRNNYINMLSREKILQSHKLAIDVQSSIISHLRKYYYHIEDSGVRKAPFWVLVGANMPAILVEVGYITGDRDGKRLTDRLYQKRLARGISKGIEEYFKKNN